MDEQKKPIDEQISDSEKIRDKRNENSVSKKVDDEEREIGAR